MDPPVTVVGVGIDLVDLERVRRLLADKGEHAMLRFFSDASATYLATRPDPTGHAAARIAAKEAVYKAMQTLPGARAIGWREIEVYPRCRRPAGDRAAWSRRPALCAETGGLRIQISLTHSALSAGAIAVVEAP